MGHLSCGARKSGSGCFEHIRPPTPTQGIPWPRTLRPAAGGCSPPREGAGHPGARHGASPAPGHGSARLGSAPVRPFSCRYRQLYSARHGLGFFWTDKIKRGRREGRERGAGEGRERKQLHGCRMSRTALHGRRGGFSLRFSGGRASGSGRRLPGPARRGGETSVPALPAACPAASPLTGT